MQLIDELKPPASTLARAPPSFNQWINDSGDLQDAPELDFARGRTVLTVGDRCACLLPLTSARF